MLQLPYQPPLPPGFQPPPMDAFGFAMFYLAVLELILIALPQKVSRRILEGLFPVLRRHL